LNFLAVKSRAYGHWGFPKGHVENDESEEQTAIREVFEETGLSVDLLNGFKAKTQYLLSKDILKEVIYFVGISLGESINIQTEEIQEYKWLKYSEMIDILNFDNIKQILKESHDFLLNSVT
jgi:bis(5'-nucleosidyl)-tetraphosphatase